MNEAAVAPRASRRAVARTVALAGLIALALVGLRASSERWQPAQALWWARGTGWIAFGALLASLSATPLARIAARASLRVPAWWPLMRRALGMTAAWFGLLHALASLSGPLAWNWNAVWSWSHLRAGLSALAILVVLLLTSFARVIAVLRLRFWRELHRLAYVAPLFVLQHVLLGPFAPRSLALALVLATCVLGLARCL